MQDNILQRIKAHKARFSPGQMKIAGYLLNNHERAAFLSATQLAREVGVSQPTVIRFAQQLGFSRYPQFVEAFQDLVKAQLTSIDRFYLSLDKTSSTKGGSPEIILREIRTLTRFARTFPSRAVAHAVKQIIQQDRIVVLGTRGSASLVQHFAYFLSKVKRRVLALTHGSTTDYDRLMDVGAEDLVVAVAFPRYPRETVEMVRFCQAKNPPILAITDKLNSPLASLAEHTIIVPVTFSTIFDSYCAVLCLFNIMVTEVGRGNQVESAELFRDFEDMAQQIRIFLQDGESDAPPDSP